MESDMNTPEKAKNEEVFRRSSLIAGRTGKMAMTYVFSTICVAAVTAVDSLFAGVCIGPEALAAIAAAAPFLTLNQILHCLLVFGVDKMMIQAIGRGKRKEADRIFGSILIAVAVVYLLVYIPLLIIERPLLEHFLTDQVLSDMIVCYTRPLFATSPIFEVFLCIERAFRVDGRAGLFSKRSIITNIANILFDFLLVSVIGMNVSGLAWSSVISTALGYTVSLSHFFSKKRTVSPDFSVIFSRRELLSYVKADIRIGSSATLDELMESFALSAQTAAIGIAGGSGGLAVWAVFKALQGIVLSMSNGVSASVSVHAGMSYGQKDYDGVRYSVRRGILIAVKASLVALIFVLVLAHPITEIYNVEPEFHSLCVHCLRIGCTIFPAIAFLTVISVYLPSVGRIDHSNLLVLLYKGLIIIAAGIGYFMDLRGFFAVYVFAIWAAALIVIVFLVRDRFWFVPEHNPEMITEYSIRLTPNQISVMSVDAAAKLNGCDYPSFLFLFQSRPGGGGQYELYCAAESEFGGLRGYSDETIRGRCTNHGY